MNLDPTSMMLSLAFSSIGLGYFLYGKRQNKPMLLFSGVLLMGYGYFVSGVWLTIVLGVGLMAVPWLVARLQSH